MALPHSTNPEVYPPRFQFGQTAAPCGGSSCCTDTCIQMIVEFYKERHDSLSTIRKLSQSDTAFNEHPCTGINYIEVLTALEREGITHYRAGFGADIWDVWQKVETGPVIVGVWYGSYPSWHGSNRNNEAEWGGRTDYNFGGSHAVLAIGKRYHNIDRDTAWEHRDFITRDPDHNSASRPEEPRWDRIRMDQLDKAMKDLPRYSKFNSTYIIYPTRKKVI